MSNTDIKKKMLARFESLYNEIQTYIEKCRADSYAQINYKLLGKAVVDYFEDIEKLKLFEGMKKVNEAKIYAYETFWLLQRKPIQISNGKDIPEAGLYLNEFIYAAMMTSKMYEEAGISIKEPNQERLRYIRLLFYNFKYRQYTQKTLELSAEAFFLGCSHLK